MVTIAFCLIFSVLVWMNMYTRRHVYTGIFFKQVKNIILLNQPLSGIGCPNSLCDVKQTQRSRFSCL